MRPPNADASHVQDAGTRFCFIWASLPRASDAQRYMRAAHILSGLVLMSLTSCSTSRIPTSSSIPVIGPVYVSQAAPTGVFLGPATEPVLKLHLVPDGTYVAEDIGPPEFWMMMEGNKVYPQRIKYPPQEGRWTWDRETGQLTLRSQTPGFRWALQHLQFDKNNPNRLAWGRVAFLERPEK